MQNEVNMVIICMQPALIGLNGIILIRGAHTCTSWCVSEEVKAIELR